MNEIITGDCLDVMRTFPDNRFSGIVCDPPYGLGFMGKHWDAGLPHDAIWKEALRIVKPGAHLLAFGGTRTFHRLTCAIEDAGWEIRDCISWLYGSGFPKSHNNFGIPGYGTALKPSWEPCIVAMKPLEGTFKQNAEKWGQAGINIDATRILSNEYCVRDRRNNINKNKLTPCYGTGIRSSLYSSHNKGRWPSNLILDEESAQLLDQQSGFSKSPGKTFRGASGTNAMAGAKKCQGIVSCPNDSGGASRFFYCAKASPRERNEGLEGFPEIKNSNGDKWSDIDRRDVISDTPIPVFRKNPHPTVKPLSLMRYLITLIAPPKDALILDLFAGSGSTIVAAQELGIKAIGIEKEPEYAEIARARVAHTAKKVQTVVEQTDLFNDR